MDKLINNFGYKDLSEDILIIILEHLPFNELFKLIDITWKKDGYLKSLVKSVLKRKTVINFDESMEKTWLVTRLSNTKINLILTEYLNVKNVKELQIDYDFNGNTFTGRSNYDFTSCYNLESLKLRKIDFDDYKFPYENLKKLVISNCYYNSTMFKNILSKCSQLECLKIDEYEELLLDGVQIKNLKEFSYVSYKRDESLLSFLTTHQDSIKILGISNKHFELIEEYIFHFKNLETIKIYFIEKRLRDSKYRIYLENYPKLKKIYTHERSALITFNTINVANKNGKRTLNMNVDLNQIGSNEKHDENNKKLIKRLCKNTSIIKSCGKKRKYNTEY